MGEYFAVFILGGVMYGGLELLWRGWTHWTMLLCGGVCFALMYRIGQTTLNGVKKCVMSAAVITSVEFVTGCVVNIKLGLGVWDYSSQGLNLMGQICPRFALMWLGLSVPGLWVCARLRRAFAAARGGGDETDNQ